MANSSFTQSSISVPVVVAQGGTGRATTTAYGVIIGGTTDTGANQSVALGTSTHVLTSNGAGAAPTFQAATSGAPTDATYIVQTANGSLSAEQALGALATGIVKNTTTTGVLSIAVNSDLPAMSATVGGAVPTPPNNTTTFLRGDGTFAAPSGGGPTSVSMIPFPAWGNTAQDVKTKAVNTVLSVGKIYIPATITVQQIAFIVSTVGASGTLKVALFSEDGQTQLFSVTTASISGASTVITAVSATVVAAGYYFIAVLPVSTANVTVRVWRTGADIDTTLYTLTGKQEYSGSVTVTASTMPATFDPTALTQDIDHCLAIRLDN